MMLAIFLILLVIKHFQNYKSTPILPTIIKNVTVADRKFKEIIYLC